MMHVRRSGRTQAAMSQHKSEELYAAQLTIIADQYTHWPRGGQRAKGWVHAHPLQDGWLSGWAARAQTEKASTCGPAGPEGLRAPL